MRNVDLLEKRDLFDRFNKKQSSFLSTDSFINIFIWKDFFEFTFEIINQQLCVFAKNALGIFLYLPPLGEGPRGQTLLQCFELMKAFNQGRGITRIENVSYNQKCLYPFKHFECYKKGYEYIYYRPDLVQFRGNSYKTKRWACNFFVKHYQYEYKSYQKEMLEDCIALYERWAQQRSQKYSDDIFISMLDENRTVHACALTYFKELNLIGRVIYIDKKIKAYSFGYALNNCEFCILFEITDLKIKGLAPFIFRKLCADPDLAPYKFINVMDDFGIAHIRNTKMSFRPQLMFPVYTISEK